MVTAMEDPYEGLFGLEIPFYAGGRLVVQGQATHAGKVVEALLTAIFRAPAGTFPEEFLVRSRTVAALLLRISDTVCRRAGVTRLTAPLDSAGVVSVPAADAFADMAAWVRFDVDELFGQYPQPARSYLENLLVREQGTDRIGELDELLILKPLVRSESTLTVGSPAELMATLRHHIIVNAHESGCAAALAEQLREFAIAQTWSLLGGIVDAPPQAVDGDAGWTWMSAPFDRDKTLDVFVISDDLVGYDAESPYGVWHGQPAFNRAVAAAESSETPGRRLRLFVYQGMGRDLAAGFPSIDEDISMLFLSTVDLETMLQTPGTDDLSLWYFAQASTRFHERAEVLYFSTVDLWSTYLDRQSSFYLSDEELPSAVFIEPGSGQELRVANARRIDRRHLVHPRTRTVCEAFSMHGPDSSAVYMVRGSGGVSFFVDMGAVDGWVHLTPSGAMSQVAGGGLFDVGVAAAYWLWQIHAHYPELIVSAAEDGQLEISMRVFGEEGETGSWVRPSSTPDENLILEIAGAPVVEGDDAPNAADRILVAALLTALGVSSGQAEIVDGVAPTGIKRMIQAFGSTDDPLAWPGRLGGAWHLNDAAVAQVLDELGAYLVDDRAMRVGEIPNEQRTSILNRVVTPWLIDTLSALLGDLSSEGLIERFVERNEAVISTNARDSAHLPARIACFGATSDEVERIEKHQRSANTSMLASRFLIEYASAFPPTGDKPLTREVYDRALGLASEIIHKGMLSDSIQHGLSTTRLSILPSRRLGTDRDDDQYVAALDAYARSRAEATYASAEGAAEEAVPRTDFDRDEVDALAEREFGFSYSDLAAAVRTLLDLMEDADHADVLSIDVHALQQELCERLEWSGEKVDQLLAQVSLTASGGSVSEFWGQGVSVRPWRFSRERSYLRRPIVLSEAATKTVATFGRRALWHALPYWTHQFTSGRLQARTPEMRSALSRRRHQKGEEYERQVVRDLEGMGYTHIRRRLRRVGQYDFRNIDGRDLGDVDVVAVRADRRELLLLEVKDLEVARTPAELANEVNNLVGEGNSAVRRLLQRSAWIDSHLDLTMRQLGVEDHSGRWLIRPVVVVNEPLLSERLLVSDVPIVSNALLREHLVQVAGRRLQRNGR